MQCKAYTNYGTQCQREGKSSRSKYCSQHANYKGENNCRPINKKSTYYNKPTDSIYYKQSDQEFIAPGGDVEMDTEYTGSNRSSPTSATSEDTQYTVASENIGDQKMDYENDDYEEDEEEEEIEEEDEVEDEEFIDDNNDYMDNSNDTYEYNTRKIYKYVRAGNLDKLKNLFSRHKHIDTETLSKALNKASRNGDYEIVRYLLYVGIVPSKTTLHKAFIGNDFRVIKLLIGTGINPDGVDLKIAIYNNNLPLIKYLYSIGVKLRRYHLKYAS
jgi:hypothetical protein